MTVVSGLLIALIAWSGGMLFRHYVWGDGTARAFVLVTGAYFVAFMVGWRLVVLLGTWFGRRTGSVDAAI
jgi:Na+(H+)/acetate symporter ActP